MQSAGEKESKGKQRKLSKPATSFQQQQTAARSCCHPGENKVPQTTQITRLRKLKTPFDLTRTLKKKNNY